MNDSLLQNPFCQDWNTPRQTPPFSQIKAEHYQPAFEEGIRLAKEEIAAIRNNPETPSFQNTVVALEHAGRMLNRVTEIFFNILECDGTPEMHDIADKVQPMLTEFSNSIHLDQRLFQRIKTVYEQERDSLNPLDRKLLEDTYDGFIHSGANLNEEGKRRFNELSIQLANLTLAFGHNALEATNAYTMHLTDAARLQGLPESALSLAAHKAKAQKLEGYLFDLSAPCVSAILKYADDRDLRHEMYLHSASKAFHDQYDNCQNILDIVACRHQIAQLLGYKTFADYALHDRMAKTTDRVYGLLDELKTYALPAGKREIAELQQYAEILGFTEPLQRWDYAYYTEKQQQALFNLSTEALKPYFELQHVIKGVLGLAENLYGLRFVETDKIEKYHPDVKVYEVFDGDRLMAVLYLDFHPRATKRSGAWMTNFREQYVDEKGQDVRPLVSLVMNFTPATAQMPSLLTFGELTTFLHEFGHALNSIVSDVPYASLSGTNSPRDFVELPSQLNENWAVEPSFLETFAQHYETGEHIPEHYVSQIRKMRQFMAGYACTRQLSFGYLDMQWHTTPPEQLRDVYATEREVFDTVELFPVVEDACMSTSFSHLFSGGYAAGYYGYKWAEMLEADAFNCFVQEGVMNRKTAQRYRQAILSRGGSVDAMQMFTDFTGHEPTPDALLRREGLK
ncbi:MAG: M3 family metallopeptidase [Bacteroidales bacterium]|nr:M3 family metallopeptidase [Bacteroidales bacterium]